MGGNVWLNLLGSGAIVTVILSIINAMFNKKKLGADTTKVITDAAAGTLKDLREDYSRVRGENKELRDDELRREKDYDALVYKQERFQEECRRVLILHAAWDHIALTRDPTLPEAPPLQPPMPYDWDPTDTQSP